MKIHVLHCGTIRVSETVPFGNGISLKNTGLQLFSGTKRRVTLPVCAYLVEHPKRLLLKEEYPKITVKQPLSRERLLSFSNQPPPCNRIVSGAIPNQHKCELI